MENNLLLPILKINLLEILGPLCKIGKKSTLDLKSYLQQGMAVWNFATNLLESKYLICYVNEIYKVITIKNV